MFEMFTWELHATFLRNHNTRAHRTPSRGHLNTGDAQAPEVPASPAATTARSTGALHPIWGTAPDMGHYTRYGALHPIWDAAPDMGHCTRTEEVHCLRIGCSAPTHKNKRGTGKANHSPTTTSPGSHPPWAESHHNDTTGTAHPSMRCWARLVAVWARRPRCRLSG